MNEVDRPGDVRTKCAPTWRHTSGAKSADCEGWPGAIWSGGGSYRPTGGVSPAFKIVEATSGDARKRSSARAASGCRAALVIAPAKENPG